MQWHAENAKDNPKILHASERCASGIIEAIGHFKLGQNLSPRDVSDSRQENLSPYLEIVNFALLIEKWRRAEVENSELVIAGIKATVVRLISFIFTNYLLCVPFVYADHRACEKLSKLTPFYQIIFFSNEVYILFAALFLYSYFMD